MQPGQIIILNGTSSAGKSTLAKALQTCLSEPYLHLGIDTVIFALPKRYLYPPHWHEVFRYHWPPDRNVEGLEIEAGPYGHQLINGLHHAVAALSRAGQHVIVDHVLLELNWVQECAVLFAELPALFVGVYCRWRSLSSASASAKIARWARRVPSITRSTATASTI